MAAVVEISCTGISCPLTREPLPSLAHTHILIPKTVITHFPSRQQVLCSRASQPHPSATRPPLLTALALPLSLLPHANAPQLGYCSSRLHSPPVFTDATIAVCVHVHAQRKQLHSLSRQGSREQKSESG